MWNFTWTFHHRAIFEKEKTSIVYNNITFTSNITKWAWMNDQKLQQDGTIQYATTENHNWFGANLSRIGGTTYFS